MAKRPPEERINAGGEPARRPPKLWLFGPRAPLTMNLQRRIRDAIKASGFSRAEIARMTGLSASEVAMVSELGRIRLGRGASGKGLRANVPALFIDDAILVCAVINVSIGELLDAAIEDCDGDFSYEPPDFETLTMRKTAKPKASAKKKKVPPTIFDQVLDSLDTKRHT